MFEQPDVRRDGQTGLDHLARLLVLTGGKVGVGEAAILDEIFRRRGEPPLVEVDRLLRPTKRRIRADQLVSRVLD